MLKLSADEEMCICTEKTGMSQYLQALQRPLQAHNAEEILRADPHLAPGRSVLIGPALPFFIPPFLRLLLRKRVDLNGFCCRTVRPREHTSR